MATETRSKEWIKNYIQMVIDEVKDIPIQTRESVEFRISIAKKHDTFNRKFPSLLMMVIDKGSDFDHARLEPMLDLMTGVQSGSLNGEEVDKKLGQEYFDKYIKPNIDT